MKYQLVVIPAIEVSTKPIKFGFDTEGEVIAAKNAVADTLLFIQDDIKAMPDYTNSIFMEQRESLSDEWEHFEGDEI